MRPTSSKIGALALGFQFLRSATGDDPPKLLHEPNDPCIDFLAENKQFNSAWTLADCTEVWTQFIDTVPPGLGRRQTYADAWRDTATELRLAGTPCLAGSHRASTGVGSTIVRLLSSWVFAEEMGCDWVTPDWGTRHLNGGNGTVLYCHQTVNSGEMRVPGAPGSAAEEITHCSVVDWIEYFQLGVPSALLPKGVAIKRIEVSSPSVDATEEAKLALSEDEATGQHWDRVMLTFDLNFASRYLVSVGNWDEARRETVRAIIGQARKNFHVHPRPWYDENPECTYDSTRLNFALHVRMGDRRFFLGENLEYFDFLEALMNTVTEEVVRKGLEPPLFHVFSETVVQCPSEDAGIFDEFPTWPVEQVPGCLTAKAPHDCPEKLEGHPCSPDRPGIFEVIGKPLVLHVGQDVRNAMSCMVQADGVLMGCSTFGQLAGLLSKGISMFSMHCGGHKSPIQYRTIPPIAVAERGYMWVPVEGSWQDPVLKSTDILSGALDTLLENRKI